MAAAIWSAPGGLGEVHERPPRRVRGSDRRWQQRLRCAATTDGCHALLRSPWPPALQGFIPLIPHEWCVHSLLSGGPRTAQFFELIRLWVSCGICVSEGMDCFSGGEFLSALLVC
jgi:hypothetical protein